MSSSSLPNNNENLVIIIAGPTGVGKSDVAAKICAINRGMIVSADSVQAYRGVQIGANKPTLSERQETPHLLVDMVDAPDQYNAAGWRRDALSCIDSLLQREDADDDGEVNPKLPQLKKEIADAKQLKGYKDDDMIRPVVVGGTMMYLQWLVHGRPDATRPTEQAIQKAQKDIQVFQDQPESDGWENAIAHVSSLNPIFEARVQKLCGKDWYRLRRTMEIAYTVLDRDEPAMIESLYSGEREGGLESFGYDVRCIFLCPSDRMEHASIVDQRCEEMILRGLFQETTDLEVAGLLPDMATKAIGYRQVLDYLQRPDAKYDDADSFDSFLNDFSTATRRYAKKQMQWFRKDDKFAFVPVSLQDTKSDRVEMTAKMVQELCQLSRQDYEAALKSKDASEKVPLSYETRLANEAQGKKMKFYQFQRYKLKKGSKEFETTLQHADECTARIKEYQDQKGEDSSEKRPRLL